MIKFNLNSVNIVKINSQWIVVFYLYKMCFFQMKKLQDKVEKCKTDVETTKGRFEAALNDINSYNAKYMEEMAEVMNPQRPPQGILTMYLSESPPCYDLSLSESLPCYDLSLSESPPCYDLSLSESPPCYDLSLSESPPCYDLSLSESPPCYDLSLLESPHISTNFTFRNYWWCQKSNYGSVLSKWLKHENNINMVIFQ